MKLLVSLLERIADGMAPRPSRNDFSRQRSLTMKKVLYLAQIVFVMLVLSQNALAGDMAIGFFEKDADCVLVRGQEKKSCKKHIKIYNKDIIETTQQPDAIFNSAQWLDDKKTSITQVKSNTYAIAYSGVTEPKSILTEALTSFLSRIAYFNSAMSKTTYATSRSAFNNQLTGVVLPGAKASIFKERDIQFSWCNKDVNQLTVLDAKGETLLEKDAAGLSSLTLSPKSLPLEQGKALAWRLGDKDGKVYFQGELTLTPEDVSQPLRDAFGAIEADKTASEATKASQKLQLVHFVQMLHGDAIDLSWLFAELQRRYAPELANTPDAKIIEMLSENFSFSACP
jgi:hypothetical protein